jgi:hypothetical protein
VKPTEAPRERGKSHWLDNITGAMLDAGKIQRAAFGEHSVFTQGIIGDRRLRPAGR